MEINIWKLLFFVSISLLIAETLLIGYFWNVGNNLIEDENYCALDVCSLYDAYYFDVADNNCYCFDNQGEVALTSKIT